MLEGLHLDLDEDDIKDFIDMLILLAMIKLVYLQKYLL